MKIHKLVIAAVSILMLGTIIFYLSRVPDNPVIPEVAQANTDDTQPPPAPAKETEPETEDTAELPGSEAPDRKLREILLATDEYLNDTKDNTTIVTQNGILYNATAELYITPEYLAMREYLADGYIIENAQALYLLPEDISKIIPDYSSANDNLKLCIAAPNGEGFTVATKGAEQTEILAEQYDSLISVYNTDHGDVRRITGSTAEYAALNEQLKQHQNTDSDFFIRYGKRDDKYAVVIASPKNKYDLVLEYVFKFNGNVPEIALYNIEKIGKSKIYVNARLPDLDINLLPNYDLLSYEDRMMTDYEGITEALIADGFLDPTTEENKNEVLFISKTDKYLFTKYADGQMFVGKDNGEQWILSIVESPQVALDWMNATDENPPDFIFIWE